MENIIIAAIVIVLIVLGVVKGRGHFKGQGGCCGGGAPVKVPKKKLGAIIGTKTVRVEDMTCDHCKARVEMAVNAIDGAAGKVNLMAGTCVVSMEREVSDDEIRAAIEGIGYGVISVS